MILTLAVAFAQAADLTVGSATARSGEKSIGVLTVAAGVDAAPQIPVIVVNGAKPGPKLALLAGAHGTEYASIIALEKLAQEADAASLSGALIIVPMLNTASFLQKVPHLNPVDGKNMNRLYPGKADGTQTERALWAVTDQVLKQADYLIDLHGGDLDENLRRYSYWSDTGDAKLDGPSRGMVLAFGLDHIIIQRNRPTDPVRPGVTTITRQAQNMGKPSIAAEAGHAGTTDATDIEVLVRGCRNVMQFLKMLPGTAKPVENPLWIGANTVVASEHDGIFYPLVGPEAYVVKGMKIGYMTDLAGATVWDIPAPMTGVVIYIGAVPSMKKGDNIAYIGEVVDKP
jgi:uncharacterized protein